MKQVGIQEASQQGLIALGPFAQRLASIEKLNAHENAVTVRMQEVKT
jgi:histidinol dehydrogenase